MAQIAIREYDAKNMFYSTINSSYQGLQVRKKVDLETLQDNQKYVIKPDMLFGKRGKLGLIGVGLSKTEVKKWYEEKNASMVKVNEVEGSLDTFLVEPFVEHEDEYYISFAAKKDYDEVHFSYAGGIEIEENWEKVETIKVSVLKDLQIKDLEGIGVTGKKLQDIILELWNYYKNYGFVYLEVNPFCFDTTGDIVLLDMVAKIDDQEHFRQREHWKNLEFPQSFGTKENKAERYIQKLDSETGASLKMKILNPDARIWTLLAGGGGSLVMTDSLGALGFADDIGNYGELSGNPDRDFTREYTRTLFGEMLKSHAENKYLIIAGAIANFTDVAKTFAGIIDVLEEKAEEFKKQNIQILVRRGGINEKKGLKLLSDACKKLGIPAEVYGSEIYMTDILKQIKLKNE